MAEIHARQALTAAGWSENVRISVSSDGRISHIKTVKDLPETALDLLLPSPVNLHSHAFQRAMAGLAEARGTGSRDSFWTWRHLMFRFLEQMSPEQVEAISALAFMEMLEAGYGAVAEFHYLHNQKDGSVYQDPAEMCGRIIAAAETAGIGLTLLPTIYCQGGCDRRPLQSGQLRFANNADSFAALHANASAKTARSNLDCAIGVAAHSLRAVDPVSLAVAVELAAEGPFHIHAAEQTAEIGEVAAHLGARPVAWLLENQPVNDRWCVIHATHLTESETSGLAASGAVAGLCPITESNLGDGIFAGELFARCGGRFGIGSDSNVHVDLFDELKTLEYAQRLQNQRRAILADRDRSTGRFLFESAAGGGAAAAARACGAIAAGNFADLIGLQTDNEWVCGRKGDAVLDSLVFTGRGRNCISDVWSAGRHLVQDGWHIGRERIVAEYRRAASALGREI